MRDEELTAEEKVELFHNLQKRHREEEHKLRQVIAEQQQEIENLNRIIEDRKRGYELLYRRYLEWKYPKTDDNTEE